MKTRLAYAVLFGLISAHVAAGFQQAACEIIGIVVDDTGLQSVEGAVVTASPGSGQRAISTLTNRAGQFRFTNLPPDRYLLTASKNTSHAQSAYGSRRVGGPGTRLVLAARAVLNDIRIQLPRTAVLSGTVLDRNGQPAIRAEVEAIMLPTAMNALASVTLTARTRSDGGFRLSGLVPGEYLVRTRITTMAGSDISAPTDADVDRMLEQLASGPVGRYSGQMERIGSFAMVPTFYPGTAEPALAERVALRAGEHRTLAGFTLQMVDSVSISGSVHRRDGTAAVDSRVSLEPAGGLQIGGPAPLSAARTTRAERDGSFRFRSVPAGRYVLRAQTASAAPSSGQRPVPHELEWAVREIGVVAEDVNDVTLTLAPALAFSGSITIDGATTVSRPLGPLRMVLKPVDAGATGTYRCEVDGTKARFSCEGVLPGRYQPIIYPSESPPADAIDLRVGGRDALDEGLVLDGVADATDAVLRLTRSPTTLTGRLQLPGGTPAADFYAVIYPEDQSLWRANSRRIRSVRPDADGRFVFRGLPPGVYLTSAMQDLDESELAQADFLRAISPFSVRVTLAPGEQKSYGLAIVR